MLRFRSLFAFLAVATTLLMLAGSVDARPSGGGSFGSRGGRTFQAPAPTATAPNVASPMQRTVTQPTQAARPGSTAAAPAAGGMFGRFGGFGGGLMAGLLGAGLFGMLMGNGMFGGLGGFASIIGLLLQVALIVIVARLAWAWWQRRNAPATAAGPSFLRDAMPDQNRNTAYYGSGAQGTSSGAASAAPSADITLDKADYDDFERLLSEVSLAYGAEDLAKLRSRVTPEMLSYFSEELSANASRGRVNEVSDVKLLQGDLSEAWHEGSTEYATLAMRYAITDATIERATGQVVEGSRTPQETTELWTFMRSPGGQWILSAIQQA
jgi:predicted lipid-binding transport protein (Tim44 family)